MGATTDQQTVAQSWLSAFSAAVSSGDAKAVAATFLPYGWLRDVLTFIWDNRSLSGPEAIAAYLAEDNRLSTAEVTDIKLDQDPHFQPFPTVDPTGAHGVEFGFVFQTPRGIGKGFVRLRQDGELNWKALTVSTMIVDWKGHEEREGQLDYEAQGKTWTELFNETKAKVEADPYVLVGAYYSLRSRNASLKLVFIVGGGQAGLTVAARFNQMDIPTLLIEKNDRIGDNWRKRYASLALHTPKEHHQRTCPEQW